jgi:hypothetical protein
MLKNVRIVLAGLTLLALCVGYCVSILVYPQSVPEYYSTVDSPVFRGLALLLLLLAVIAACLPREEQS